jgi:hypothetical protein
MKAPIAWAAARTSTMAGETGFSHDELSTIPNALPLGGKHKSVLVKEAAADQSNSLQGVLGREEGYQSSQTHTPKTKIAIQSSSGLMRKLSAFRSFEGAG